jgi:hypothetical protein
MPSRRQSRYEKLFSQDATRVVEDALQLRSTIIRVNLHLVPFNEQYRALHDVTEAIDAALPLVAGKLIDYRAPDLGLLPVLEYVRPRFGRKV